MKISQNFFRFVFRLLISLVDTQRLQEALCIYFGFMDEAGGT